MRALLVGLLVVVAGVPFAAPGAEPASVAEKERAAKVRAVEDALMAPCCWVNTLSNHSSAQSEQLKGEIRARVDQGQSVDEIIDFYVTKYGERILAAPQASGFNILAWVMPFVFVSIGAVVCLVWMWRRRAGPLVTEPESSAATANGPSRALIEKMEAELARMD